MNPGTPEYFAWLAGLKVGDKVMVNRHGWVVSGEVKIKNYTKGTLLVFDDGGCLSLASQQDGLIMRDTDRCIIPFDESNPSYRRDQRDEKETMLNNWAKSATESELDKMLAQVETNTGRIIQ